MIIIIIVTILEMRELRLGKVKWYKVARLGAEPQAPVSSC